MNPVAKNASMFNLQKVLARKLDENESELFWNKSNGAKKFKRWICLNIIYDIKVKIKIDGWELERYLLKLLFELHFL